MSTALPLTYYQRWGLLPALQAALLYRLQRWLGLHVYGVYSRDFVTDRACAADMCEFTLRMFLPGDADALIAQARNPELGMCDDFIRRALEKGDVCSAVLHRGELVAYVWSAFAQTHHEDAVFIDFGPGYRYGYKAFTLPAYRGRHLLQALEPLIHQYCRDQCGRTQSISFVAIENRPSIHYSMSIGNRRIGYAGYVRLGSLFWSFRTAGVRQSGFRFSNRRPGAPEAHRLAATTTR